MKFVKRNTTKGSGDNTVTIKAGGYSNSSSSSSNSSLTLTSHNIWGQPFDGTNDVTGDMQNVGSITATGNIQTDGDIIIKQLDTDGNEVEGGDFTLTLSGNILSFKGKNYNFYGNTSIGGALDSRSLNVGQSFYVDDDAVIINQRLCVGGTDNQQGSDSLYIEDTTIDNDNDAIIFTNRDYYEFDGTILGENAEISKDLTVAGTSTLNNVTSNNITNSNTIKTKNLEVTGSAHFFELIIDKIKAAGGAVLFTPADGFQIDYVKNEGTSGYKLYWRCRDSDGNQRDNKWMVGDQALCMSFNQAKVGTSYGTNNKYYWALVTDKSDTTKPQLREDGNYYHWILISSTDYDGTLNPEVGDNIVMCGYRGTNDTARQSAIYISAYSSLDKGLTAPLFAQYRGINDFNLESHRKSYFDSKKCKIVGEFVAESGTTFDDIVNKVNNMQTSAKMLSSQDYYLLTNQATGVTQGTSGWTETYQTPTETNKYLWKVTRYRYDDNNDVWSLPIIFAEYVASKGGADGKDAEYYTIEFINKAINVYVDDKNVNGVLKCSIRANIYKVKGTTKQLQSNKGLTLDFYNAKDTLVKSVNADTSNPYERDYINTALQTNYLTSDNQIVYCIAETYDL